VSATKEKVRFWELGNMPFDKTWDFQTNLHTELVQNKRAGYPVRQKHHLIFVEHPHVYTLGRTGSLEHLLLDENELQKKHIEFFKINRGGDITYHGPGQIVAYPIFDLDLFFTDVHKYVRYLEESVIRLLAIYNIKGTRMKGYTGVWLAADGVKPNRKICAIGVHLSRWVTLHGLAFNIQTNLDYFNHIIPCGIQEDDKVVTSLQAEVEEKIDYQLCKDQLKSIFAELFEFDYISK
jgi:lipoyl(octanoyl) transferase